MSFQRSESSQNHVQRCDRRWKFENFEIFYFLVFRFPWSILHIHFGSRPIHSARVGSPLAFYALYISIQSCDYFKRFSVNGIPIKIVAGMVKVQYTIQNEKLGRPCANLIFKKEQSGGTLHCVNDVAFESFFAPLKTHQKPIFDIFWRCGISSKQFETRPDTSETADFCKHTNWTLADAMGTARRRGAAVRSASMKIVHSQTLPWRCSL